MTIRMGAALAAAVLMAGTALAGQGPSSAARARAEALVARMTDAEKLRLLHGLFPPMATGKTAETLIPSAGHIDGVPRLGIPTLRESDASLGWPTRSSRGRATLRPRCPPASPPRRASTPP